MRARGEAKAREIEAGEAARTSDQTAALVHELRVHEFELEIQNEELRRAQVAPDQARARYVDLYDRAPVGYLTVDDRGRIVESNLRAGTLLLTPREELLGQPITRFVSPVDQDLYYLSRRRVGQGDPVVVELRMRRQATDEFWARLEMVAASDEFGAPSAVRVALSDVGEIRLMRAERELSDRIVSVGVMAASVAHDLNNPLTYVLYQLESVARDLPRLVDAEARWRAALAERIGASGIAARGAGAEAELQPAESAALIDQVKQALEGVRHIEAVSRRLAYFASAEPEGPALVDLNDAARLAVQMASREVRYRAVMAEELGSVPKILASKGQLAQVFLNLLLNAAQSFGERSSSDNRVTLRTWADDSGQVFASVQDTGCGIPAENLRRIFEPFFTTGTSGGRMGLGMAIAHRLVSGFGGSIRVVSAPGEGTTVELRFPAAVTAPARATSTAEPPPVRGRVLIVDDDDRVRAVLVRLLEVDHEVASVGSARAAMSSLAAGERFDVILCDLVMPEVTGMDFHAWLRHRDPSLAGSLIFVTGGAFTADADRYLASVSNTCLKKPFELGILRRLVAQGVTAARSQTSP